MRLFLSHLYTSDRSKTYYSPEVLQTLSKLVITQHRVYRLLQLHGLVIEPPNYTYHSSRVPVALPWLQKLELCDDAPPGDEKVIPHFPMENSDPVTI